MSYRKSQDTQGFWELFFALRRALGEFLLVPTLVIAGFLVLAFITYLVDSTRVEWVVPIREVLRKRVFANSEATTGLLESIAGGIITLTSITISLLLVAVQQSAGSMTGQVFDQFLRRRMNQIYFGFFVGLALFSLITLATVNEPFNPVIGASTAFVGAVIALYLLIILFYTTIHQMRPDEIIRAIHEHILVARERQIAFIARTRPSSEMQGGVSVPVFSKGHGYVTRVNLDLLEEELSGVTAEVTLLVSIGTFVAYGDKVAVVRASAAATAQRIADNFMRALELEHERDIGLDPAYGISQLETIAWTSISTSKSNPAPGLSVIRALRDVLSRWSEEEPPVPEKGVLQLIYHDNTFETLFDAFENLAVVSSESLQHQNFTEIARTFAISFDRLPEDRLKRAEDLILRILSVLGEFALTRELELSLKELRTVLEKAGREEVSRAVGRALEQMSRTIGYLGSRATRTGE